MTKSPWVALFFASDGGNVGEIGKLEYISLDEWTLFSNRGHSALGPIRVPSPASVLRTDPNQPRDTVSWYEAMAYARWLDARLRETGLVPEGSTVRLPTKEEWDQAACGNKGRFPWRKFASGRANIAVGLYPAEASASGALDMAGTVWEWCLNELRAQDNEADRQSPRGSARRVVQGGSWPGDPDCHYARTMRAAPTAAPPPSAAAATTWVCGWCVWLPSPEPLATGTLALWSSDFLSSIFAA